MGNITCQDSQDTALEVKMSRTGKWILGFLIVLLVVCAAAAVGFAVFGRYARTAMVTTWFEQGEPERGRIQPWEDMPMHPGRIPPVQDMPRMPYRAFPGRLLPGVMPFGGFFGILLCLGFLLLLGLSAAALVISLGRPRNPTPAAVAAPAPTAASLPASPEPVAPSQACPSCQRAVNDDWSHCPYCGTALTPGE
jgi:hypothetical protein